MGSCVSSAKEGTKQSKMRRNRCLPWCRKNVFLSGYRRYEGQGKRGEFPEKNILYSRGNASSIFWSDTLTQTRLTDYCVTVLDINTLRVNIMFAYCVTMKTFYQNGRKWNINALQFNRKSEYFPRIRNRWLPTAGQVEWRLWVNKTGRRKLVILQKAR